MTPMTRGGIKRKQEEIENTKFKAVNILLQNGWLSARDLCRLESTSSSSDFKQWIVEDEAWKTLCCSHFPNSERLSQAFIRSLGGYKMLYRHRTSALLVEDQSKLAPLPVPDLCANQLMLLVDVTVAGESAISTALSGDGLKVLLETGSAAFSVTKPFVVGNASCWFSEENDSCTCGKCRFNCFQYDARIHFLRVDNAAKSSFLQCCVYVPGEKEWTSSMTAEPIGDGKYDWKNGTSEWLNCFETFSGIGMDGNENKGLALKRTPEAALVEQRLQGKVCFGFSIELSVMEPGDKIAVSGFQIEAMYHGHGKEEWEDYNEACAKRMGVSLLHVLEQLDGRDGDMNPPKGNTAYVYEEYGIVSVE